MYLSKMELALYFIFWVILITLKMSTQNTSYSTSVENLKSLVIQEQSLIESLGRYTEQLEEKLYGIRRLLNEYKRNSEEDPELNVDNFCQSLPKQKLQGNWTCGGETTEKILVPGSVAKKYVNLLQLTTELEELVTAKSRYEKDVRETIKAEKQKLPQPSPADRIESIWSLLNLIRTYNLNEEDVAKGKLMHYKTHSMLSITNLLELGNHALRHEMFKQAVNLFDQGLQLSISGADNEFGQLASEMFYKKLDKAVIIHDENFDNKSHVMLHFFNERLIGKNHSAFKNRKKRQTPITTLNPDEYHQPEMFLNFDRLCQQGYSQPLLEKLETLNCVYNSKAHPYWTIAPLQIEILQKDPFVVQIYNILSESKMKFLISSARPNMNRSQVIADPDADSMEEPRISFFRSSVNAWLDDVHPETPFSFVNEIVERVTGFRNLRVTFKSVGSEIIQVANYATGGKYLPHVDAVNTDMENFNLMEKMAGDRLATFMFYLNNVKLGGGTAFPALGVVARAVAGSALFWFNLHANGSIDTRTVHGGCPVLYGNKWVANKWVRANAQTFTYKCAPDGSTNQYFYNKYFNELI